MSLLEVRHITQQHGDNFLLDHISFSQQKGQRLAIVGETGSGKTTLMKIVAGLGQADSGEVYFEQEQVLGLYEKLMPGHPGIAYLSQHFELPKKYRVSELLDYANNLTDEAASELYRLCDITHLLPRWSQTLSGGEKQRVALARLLTETPRLLLLDEPFSNLDQAHKASLKQVIENTAQLGLTVMIISHDGADILPWADEIMVMQQGRIIQQGTPEQLYRQPGSEYIAGLFGPYNILLPKLATSLGLPEQAGRIIRPEDLYIHTDGTVSGVVQRSLYYGSHYRIEVLAGDATVYIHHHAALKPGREVFISASPAC